MIVVDIAQEILAVFIALFALRWLQGKLNSESTTGKAMAYVLH